MAASVADIIRDKALADIEGCARRIREYGYAVILIPPSCHGHLTPNFVEAMGEVATIRRIAEKVARDGGGLS